MIFNKTSQTNNFLQIVLNMDRLSYKAKGLFAYLISNYTENGVSLRQLIEASYDGQSSVISGLRELINSRIVYEVEIKDKCIIMIDFKGIEWNLRMQQEFMKSFEDVTPISPPPFPNIEEVKQEECETLEETNEDKLLLQALEMIVKEKQASVSFLQRRLRIGYTRAARIIDTLHDKGYVGPYEGSKAREVLINEEQFQEIVNEKVMIKQ